MPAGNLYLLECILTCVRDWSLHLKYYMQRIHLFIPYPCPVQYKLAICVGHQRVMHAFEELSVLQ